MAEVENSQGRGNVMQIETLQRCEQLKQEACITITGNTIPTKIVEQDFNSLCELEILNDTRILSYKSYRFRS